MAKSYTALTLLESMDGLKRWQVGETIELDDERAAILLAVRAVVPLTQVKTVKVDKTAEVVESTEMVAEGAPAFVKAATGTKAKSGAVQ